MLLRPGVVDFMDIVAKNKGIDLNLEEIVVRSGSSLNERTLSESDIRKKLNVMLIGIFQKGGEFLYNPDSSTRIGVGDRLIAIGQSADPAELNVLCG